PSGEVATTLLTARTQTRGGSYSRPGSVRSTGPGADCTLSCTRSAPEPTGTTPPPKSPASGTGGAGLAGGRGPPRPCRSARQRPPPAAGPGRGPAGPPRGPRGKFR